MKVNNYKKLKRFIDIVISSILLIVLSPILVIIGIIIKLDSEGPLFFKQTRIGKDSKPFVIYKFRTMKVSTPSNVPTYALEDASTYVTRVGKILRITSLDELPQLINIVKNEMSLIGPRPVIPEETDLIERRRALGVDQILPGVTGYAQINGRDNLTYMVKSEYDLEYMKNMSLKMDIKIILTTALKIVKSEHISH